MDPVKLGGFEELLLLCVYTLSDDAYGASIQQKVEREGRRPVSIGAVYATLDRLERKGFLRSWLGEPTALRGGRRKRHFRITSTGVRALKSIRRTRDSVWAEIEKARV